MENRINLEFNRVVNSARNLVSKQIPEEVKTQLTDLLIKSKGIFDPNQRRALIQDFGQEFAKIETNNLPKEETPKTDNTEVSNNDFDSLYTKANSEVKEGLNNFVKFLKRKNIAQEKIDNLFASGLISIVGNGYLKLGDTIIGRNEHQAIQQQIDNCQGKQFVEFLSKTSNILGLKFEEPNNMDNKLDISKDKFIENNDDFCNKNDGSDLFNSIGRLINRSYIWIPCFAINDKIVIGCKFGHDSVYRVMYYDYNHRYCVSTNIS